MSLVFLGYVVSAFMAHPSWPTVAREMVHPSFELSPLYLFTFHRNYRHHNLAVHAGLHSVVGR
jgi:hypothetical protein